MMSVVLGIIAFVLFMGLIEAQTVINCDELADEVLVDLPTLLDSFDEAEKLNITTLVCDNVGFSGSIPDSISELVNLEELSLANNELEGNLPDSFSSLTNLTKLNLNNNCLTGDLLNALFDTEIEEIAVDRNKFEGDLSDLPDSLRVFSIAFNDFDGGLADTIADVTGLEVFRVNGNRITGSIPDIFSALPLTELFLTNNDIEGTMPDHSAGDTDANVGAIVHKSTLDERWRKYTLDPKCPNRLSFAIDKMFSESLVFTLPILFGGILLFVALVLCIFCLCLRKKKSKENNSVASTQYAKDHYKIDVYMCEAAKPSKADKHLAKKLRSKLKEKHVKGTVHTSMNEGALDNAAAVLIFFTQDYFEEMSNEDTRAFMEVFSANEAGQWILFACLDKKLYTLGKTTQFLDADYHLHDMSSAEAIEENFGQLMDHLYQAQAEKEMLIKQHT